LEKLSKKGFGSLRYLGKSLRQVPSYNGFDKINKDKFLAVLRDNDILLAKQHSEVKL
jgi:hypothetical protein